MTFEHHQKLAHATDLPDPAAVGVRRSDPKPALWLPMTEGDSGARRSGRGRADRVRHLLRGYEGQA